MGYQENLSEENARILEETFNNEIKPNNPEATFELFDMKDKTEFLKAKLEAEESANNPLLAEIEKLNEKLDKIFGNHVLINGRWTNLSELDVSAGAKDK